MKVYQLNVKNFDFKKEFKETKLIVLDSKNLHGYKNENDLEEIKSYVKENISKGVYYDYIIGRNGSIVKVTPNGKCANSCEFENYSMFASKCFPKECPQYQVFDFSNSCDSFITSILTVSSNIENSEDTGEMSDQCRSSLEQLTAWLFNQNEGKEVKIVSRSSLKKQEDKNIGHKFFKGNFIELVKLTNTAKKYSSFAENCEIENVDL